MLKYTVGNYSFLLELGIADFLNKKRNEVITGFFVFTKNKILEKWPVLTYLIMEENKI